MTAFLLLRYVRGVRAERITVIFCVVKVRTADAPGDPSAGYADGISGIAAKQDLYYRKSDKMHSDRGDPRYRALPQCA